MRPGTCDNLIDALESMWNAHREFLRRFLISLARDIDLADDLLQESYLKARASIEGYQGGDSKAWLSTIAKSSFYSHLRRRYVRIEVPLGEEERELPGPMEDRLDLIRVRQAISDLPEDQRRALVMKHYAGYNYDDIAVHMGCPVGTAKSRVSSALRRLREALAVPGEEIAVVKCADLSERMLMDSIYDRLPEPERKRAEEHLAACPACRERASEVGFVLRALDAVEADVKGSFIVEIRQDGSVSYYLFISAYNDKEEPLTELSIGGCSAINYAFVNKEEARIEPLPFDPNQGRNYKMHLAHPVAPGKPLEILMIGPAVFETGIKDLGNGLRRLDSIKLKFDQETVYVLAVRLPGGAMLEKALPDAQEVRGNGAVTVVWQGVLQQDAELNFGVEYRV